MMDGCKVNTPESFTPKIRNFILFAREGWPGEAGFRALVDAWGCTPLVARDVHEIEERVRSIGEDAAHVIIHQVPIQDADQAFDFEEIRHFLGAYYRILRAKPGKGLSGFWIDPCRVSPSVAASCTAAIRSTWSCLETLSGPTSHPASKRLERTLARAAEDEPEEYKDIW